MRESENRLVSFGLPTALGTAIIKRDTLAVLKRKPAALAKVPIAVSLSLQNLRGEGACAGDRSLWPAS